MLTAVVEFVWLLVLALFFGVVFFTIVLPVWIIMQVINGLEGTLRWIAGGNNGRF